MRKLLVTAGLLSALAPHARPARAEVEPVPSFHFLTTGNGFGFQVFDVSENALTQFLERPYRYIKPDPQNPDGEGIVRRDLAFDTYFGIRSGSESLWLNSESPSEAGYVEQTNVIRSVVTVGSLKTESLFFAPYGYEGNGMVMLLRVTNEGSSAAPVQAFSVSNFKLGSAPNPDEPGANDESLSYDPDARAASETGPGGGAVVYAPLAAPDVATCAPGAYQEVASGGSLSDAHECSGDDRVQIFQKDLGSIPPGESRTWGLAVLFDAGADVAAARGGWQDFLAGRDGETLLADVLGEWEAWRTPVPGLTGDELRIWRQSEAVLRMGQVLEPYSASNPKRKNHGMVLASLPPGGWHSGWVRDAAYAIVALARTGHYEEAKKALNFFLDAEAGRFSSYLQDVDYRISTVRYFGNGVEEADYSGQPTRNIEIDGWGLFLWAARSYVDFSGDVGWLQETTRSGEVVYDVLREEIAEPLAQLREPEGMPIADASIWEVHWGNREHFTYTASTTARGFCDMAALSRRLEKMEDRDRYKALSEEVTQAIRTHFVDQNNVLAGSLEKLARGTNYRDGAVIDTFAWNLIPPEDPIAGATMNDMSRLRTPVGGYKRVEGSNDQYDKDEWILIDLRAAQVFRYLGDTERADSLLDFVTAQAAVNYDLVPELYNTSTNAGQIGRYTGSIPMVGYGAGAYMVTLLERAGHHEYQDCGTEEPPMPGDGGPMYLDAGVGAGGDGGAGPIGRTGVACLCRAGGAPGAGSLLLFLLAAAGLLHGRRRR